MLSYSSKNVLEKEREILGGGRMVRYLEESDIVVGIKCSAGLSNAVHRELGCSDINSLHTSLCRDDWSNRGSARGVVFNDDILLNQKRVLIE